MKCQTKENHFWMLCWKKKGWKIVRTEYLILKPVRKSSYYRRFWTWILVPNVESFCLQKCWSKSSGTHPLDMSRALFLASASFSLISQNLHAVSSLFCLKFLLLRKELFEHHIFPAMRNQLMHRVCKFWFYLLSFN